MNIISKIVKLVDYKRWLSQDKSFFNCIQRQSGTKGVLSPDLS